MKNWEWSFPDGKPDQGHPTTFTTETSDGYVIAVTLQQNTDGLIVCTGLNIDSVDKQKVPNKVINSRFFQLLGFGEILKSAREAYEDWAAILIDVYQEMESERETKEWGYPGPAGHPDAKYAHLAFLYVSLVSKGKENPIDQLAQHMNCDRETASSRVAEARNRGLLTRPKQTTVGGKLTSKAEKLIEVKKGRK
jgi:hypothetical protein